MTESLDNILSGREPASEQETTPKVTEEKVTQVATDGEGQQEQQMTGQTDGDAAPQGQKMVPHEALHAEKQKVKRYTDEVADFRKANENLSRQVSELLTRIPQPAPQPKPQRPDVFEDPDAFLEAGVRASVDPVKGEISDLREHYSRKDAIREHGQEKVVSAFRALDEAAAAGDPDARAVVAKVKQSIDPFGEIVDWHNKHEALTEIGKIGSIASLKDKMRADLEAEFLTKHGLTPMVEGEAQQQRQPQAAQVMPSNFATARNVVGRAGPAWSGPKPMSEIFKH